MTKRQRALFRNFSKFIMIDATFNTNEEGLPLVTVLCLDAHGEGVPVIHCLAESEDTGWFFLKKFTDSDFEST